MSEHLENTASPLDRHGCAIDLTDDELQTALVAVMHYQQRRYDTADNTLEAVAAHGNTPVSHNVASTANTLQIVSKLTWEILRRHQAGGIRQSAPQEPLRLGQLDTPQTRQLLQELKPLVALAERVDRARGRVYLDAPPDAVQGNDLAQAIQSIVTRLDLEVNGPRGRE